jgi:osmotically-inducible protein OsmY
MKIKLYSVAAVLLVLALVVPALRADDDLIFDRVRQKLNSDPDVKGSKLNIDVKDGVVTLKGSVSNDKYKAKAEKLTRKVSGVKDVVNQLTVDVPKPR